METAGLLVPILPFAGALILAVFGAKMPKKVAGAVGCISVGLAFVVGALIATNGFVRVPAAGLDVVAYRWMDVGGMAVEFGLRFDSLSMLMMLVVTFVGFLIHLYAAQSMWDEDGYSRFFSYMNLFVGSMLLLVLGDNLLMLYLGWEGVGACSYLLIGFWYKETKNGLAAQKAFVVTRIGDTAMAIGLFLIFKHFGTLDIHKIVTAAPAVFTQENTAVTLIAILLIAGAIGKSAQIPLHTWLPDAMAGPTPVSALIHAATMVTAGVYLIARLEVFFEISHVAQMIVAIIGTATLLVAGFTALVQRDIKRVLAFSTMSQIGYMFLALGVGAWIGAMFHFMTHAFFKALLFLAAGAVIDAQHHEHDIFKMGGLRKKLPLVFWTFTIGIAALSALPLVTSGFYSKDAILWAAYSSKAGNIWLLAGGLAGSVITAIYSFRLLGHVFFGEQKMEVTKRPGILMCITLVALAGFSLVSGFVSVPEVFGNWHPFDNFMATTLAAVPFDHAKETHAAEWIVIGSSVGCVLLGIAIAGFYFKSPKLSEAFGRSAFGRNLHAFLFSGFGFDWLYDKLFVRPYIFIAEINRRDIIDSFYSLLAAIVRLLNLILSQLHTGRMRNYALGMVAGAILVIWITLSK